MQEENTSQKTHKKTLKYIVFLVMGVFVTIIAICIESGGLSKYTIPVLIEYILSYLIPCFLGGGLIALIVSQRMGDVTKYWLPVFAWLFWLFLILVFCDIFIKPINEFAFKHRIEQMIELRGRTKPPKLVIKARSWSKASGPNPSDGAIHKDIWTSLSWPYGESAVSFDVYLGDNFDDVNAGAESTFIGNQTATFTLAGFPGFPYPDGLVQGTTYYWRIDEVNDTEPNSPWKGDVWSFSIPHMTDYFPYRADGAESIDSNSDLKDAVKNADKNSP